LLSLIKAIHANTKEIELTAEDDNLTVKSGNTKLKLGLMPPESFIFEMKDIPKKQFPADPGLFLEAIDNCMRSVSNDTSVPDQLGITLIVDGKSLLFFSTNNSTMSHDKIALRSDPGFSRVILSSSFCREMLRLADGASALALEIHDDCALLGTAKATLFGRLIDSSYPLPYQDMLKTLFPEKARGNLSAIDSGWRLALERASIITDASIDQVTTLIKVITDPNGVRRTRLYSKSSRGEGFESIKTDTKQPEITIKIEPKLLKAGYGEFDQMLLTNQAAIMVKGSKLYMVSATNA
jgi:DNA polymerase III sliding clamp (beta) subunit (PCNA family)